MPIRAFSVPASLPMLGTITHASHELSTLGPTLLASFLIVAQLLPPKPCEVLPHFSHFHSLREESGKSRPWSRRKAFLASVDSLEEEEMRKWERKHGIYIRPGAALVSVESICAPTFLQRRRKGWLKVNRSFFQRVRGRSRDSGNSENFLNPFFFVILLQRAKMKNRLVFASLLISSPFSKGMEKKAFLSPNAAFASWLQKRVTFWCIQGAYKAWKPRTFLLTSCWVNIE